MLACLRFLGAFVIGSSMLVSLVMLSDKALTPIPPSTDNTSPADRRLLVENDRLRAANERQDREILRLRVELDLARRNAIWLPPRPDVPPADLIPAQNLEIPPR